MTNPTVEKPRRKRLPSPVLSQLIRLAGDIDAGIKRVMDACEPEDVPEAAQRIGEILWEAKLF